MARNPQRVYLGRQRDAAVRQGCHRGKVKGNLSTFQADEAEQTAAGAAATPPRTRKELEPDQRRRFARSLARMPRRARPPARTDDLRDILEGQGTPTVLRRDARVRRSLASADLLAAVCALGAALLVGGHEPKLAALAAPFFVVAFCKLGRLYDRDEVVIRKSTLDQAPDLLEGATIYTLIFWLASDAFVEGGIGKAEAGAMWAVLTLGLIVFRCIARRLAASSTTPERLLVLGSADAAERLRGRTRHRPLDQRRAGRPRRARARRPRQAEAARAARRPRLHTARQRRRARDHRSERLAPPTSSSTRSASSRASA